MTARLIDGNALAQTVRAEVAQRVSALRERGVVPAQIGRASCRERV